MCLFFLMNSFPKSWLSKDDVNIYVPLKKLDSIQDIKHLQTSLLTLVITSEKSPKNGGGNPVCRKSTAFDAEWLLFTEQRWFCHGLLKSVESSAVQSRSSSPGCRWNPGEAQIYRFLVLHHQFEEVLSCNDEHVWVIETGPLEAAAVRRSVRWRLKTKDQEGIIFGVTLWAAHTVAAPGGTETRAGLHQHSNNNPELGWENLLTFGVTDGRTLPKASSKWILLTWMSAMQPEGGISPGCRNENKEWAWRAAPMHELARWGRDFFKRKLENLEVSQSSDWMRSSFLNRAVLANCNRWFELRLESLTSLLGLQIGLECIYRSFPY